jgi:hydroxymethylpyrimidine pyrophosphatase-like HAD family hydrolase
MIVPRSRAGSSYPALYCARRDEGHDITMIQAAGLGIAMGNACDELKRCANEVTKSDSECGVEHAIRKYVLKKYD